MITDENRDGGNQGRFNQVLPRRWRISAAPQLSSHPPSRARLPAVLPCVMKHEGLLETRVYPSLLVSALHSLWTGAPICSVCAGPMQFLAFNLKCAQSVGRSRFGRRGSVAVSVPCHPIPCRWKYAKQLNEQRPRLDRCYGACTRNRYCRACRPPADSRIACGPISGLRLQNTPCYQVTHRLDIRASPPLNSLCRSRHTLSSIGSTTIALVKLQSHFEAIH